MRGAMVLLASMVVLGAAVAEQALPKMLSSRVLAKLLPGNGFMAKARNGLLGILAFDPNGRVTFQGVSNEQNKSPPDDQGVYRISETGYCSKWKSTNHTNCWTVSVIPSQGQRRRYQVWTVYGERADTLILLQDEPPLHQPSPTKPKSKPHTVTLPTSKPIQPLPDNVDVR